MCQELKVCPAQAWFVGDESKDILGAERSGLTPVLLDRGHSAGDVAGPRINSQWDLLHLLA